MLSHAQALDLVKSYNPEPHLIRHALDSEAVMRALAAHFGEDADLWGIAGLVHDVDFPDTKNDPAKHGLVSAEILGDRVPEIVVTAIKAHNGEYTGTMPESRFDYALRAAETVTGLITAAALVRPSGMDGMEPKSLKKKMKDKAFAASVNRDTIKECEKIGLSLDEFLALAIKAMAERVDA